MCNERMNILKKTIAVLLSAALIFGAIFMSGAFSASAEDNNENIESTSASQVTSDPDESVTEAPTVEPTQEPTQEPVADPTQEPTQESTQPSDGGVIAAWDFDSTGKLAGDKLKEYGNADNGYAATTGEGTLTMSVSGTSNRALEWSDAEYGESGDKIVPIMAAGSKNKWGSPFIMFAVNTKDYRELRLTAYFGGSNKAPATWQLSYSTDGESFADIDGAAFTIPADSRKIPTAYFDGLALPEGAENAETLILKLTPSSTVTVNGGSYTDTPTGGEVVLNNIRLTGTKAAAPEVVIGDVNGDSEVDVLDASEIQKYSAQKAEFTEEQLYAGDVNGDNVVDILDAADVQKYAAEKLAEFKKKA